MKLPSRPSFALFPLLLCSAWLTVPSAHAQDAPAATAPTLRTGTQLVVVDVSVTDPSGAPVHGLKASDLDLTEDKSAQEIRHFEEHRPDRSLPGPAMPPLPPGIFTNYTPVPPDSTLNVILIDTLNTPMKDQAYVRAQLAQYVKNARPGSNVAIFGMSSRLYLLQGFTSNPDILKNAIEHKLTARASALLDDPVGTNADQQTMSDTASDAGAPALVVSSLQQFEAEQESFQTQLRMRYTLDAFNALARYLAGYPGRKNLIWFSGSFPLSLSPNPDITDPFAVMADVEEEFRETTNLLARGQVTVYPVDGRGLMTAPMFDAANSGAKYARSPTALGKDLQKFSQSQFDEHATMDQMADATGGKAYYNTNGLAEAVASAMNLGSNYYTLTYSPSNHDWNGSFRNIKVTLADAARAQGYKLTYRRGYYAYDAEAGKKRGQAASLTETSMASTASPSNYARLAMQRGAPEPNDLLLKIRVLPQTTTTTDKLADNNQLSPTRPIKPPFRNYVIDLVAPVREFSMTKTPDGHITDTITVKVFVYDADGTLLNLAGNGAHLNLTSENYQRLVQSGLHYRALISAPARGESFLRVGIEDGNTGKFGAVEVSTGSVIRLPPAESPAPQPAPASR